jgi:hypothetical protein
MNCQPPDRPFNDPLLDLLFWAGWEEIINPKYENNITSQGDAGVVLPGDQPDKTLRP